MVMKDRRHVCGCGSLIADWAGQGEVQHKRTKKHQDWEEKEKEKEKEREKEKAKAKAKAKKEAAEKKEESSDESSSDEYVCGCGSKLRKTSKPTHLRTKKHKKWAEENGGEASSSSSSSSAESALEASSDGESSGDSVACTPPKKRKISENKSVPQKSSTKKPAPIFTQKVPVEVPKDLKLQEAPSPLVPMVRCECGALIARRVLPQHLTSIRHVNWKTGSQPLNVVIKFLTDPPVHLPLPQTATRQTLLTTLTQQSGFKQSNTPKDAASVRLIHKGKDLDSTQPLKDQGVASGADVHFILLAKA